jgi:predicted nucleotide-binding protein (sugar kinase/HSP70/actin superfamily)
MAEIIRDKYGRIIFTKEMKKEYTVLVPDMLPIHFNLMKNIFTAEGYKVELLDNKGANVKQLGLKYMHNDICYPALLVAGQFLDAIKSGKYDVNKIAFIIMQTGGGCRASNYIHLLRKAIKKAGYSNIPIISFNISGLEKNSGFKLTLPIIRKTLASVIYGDLIMLLSNQTRPYEVKKGESDRLIKKWVSDLSKQFRASKGYGFKQMRENFDKIIRNFSDIKIEKKEKIKVGIVGEIYVKYAKFANNDLEKFLEEHNCEVMVPGLLGFLMFKVDARIQDHLLYGGNIIRNVLAKKLLQFLEKIENAFMEAVDKSRFTQLSAYEHTKPLVNGLIGLGNRMGEGWFLPAEMIDLVNYGYENIVCTQPFGCLPTHICGKGMVHKIKTMYPNANIVPVDYDTGATRVNQENRIKLMLSVAAEKLQNE